MPRKPPPVCLNSWWLVGRRAQIALAAAVGLLLVAGGCRVRGRPRELGQDRRRGADRRRRSSAACPPIRLATACDDEARRAARQAGHGDLRGDEVRAQPATLQLHADVDGMVDAALGPAAPGGFPTRVWRYTTGGEVNREITPADHLLHARARRVRRPGRHGDRPTGAGRDRRARRPASLERVAGQGRGHGARRGSCAHAVRGRDREPASPDRLRPRSDGSSPR